MTVSKEFEAAWKDSVIWKLSELPLFLTLTPIGTEAIDDSVKGSFDLAVGYPLASGSLSVSEPRDEAKKESGLQDNGLSALMDTFSHNLREIDPELDQYMQGSHFDLDRLEGYLETKSEKEMDFAASPIEDDDSLVQLQDMIQKFYFSHNNDINTEPRSENHDSLLYSNSRGEEKTCLPSKLITPLKQTLGSAVLEVTNPSVSPIDDADKDVVPSSHAVVEAVKKRSKKRSLASCDIDTPNTITAKRKRITVNTNSLIDWFNQKNDEEANPPPLPTSLFQGEILQPDFLKKMTFELGRYVQSGGDLCDLFPDNCLPFLSKTLYAQVKMSENVTFFQIPRDSDNEVSTNATVDGTLDDETIESKLDILTAGLDASNCLFYLYKSGKCPKHLKEEVVIATTFSNMKQTFDTLLMILFSSADSYRDDSWIELMETLRIEKYKKVISSICESCTDLFHSLKSILLAETMNETLLIQLQYLTLAPFLCSGNSQELSSIQSIMVEIIGSIYLKYESHRMQYLQEIIGLGMSRYANDSSSGGNSSSSGSSDRKKLFRLSNGNYVHSISAVILTIYRYCALIDDEDTARNAIMDSIIATFRPIIEKIISSSAKTHAGLKSFLEEIVADLCQMWSIPEWNLVSRYVLSYISQLIASALKSENSESKSDIHGKGSLLVIVTKVYSSWSNICKTNLDETAKEMNEAEALTILYQSFLETKDQTNERLLSLLNPDFKLSNQGNEISSEEGFVLMAKYASVTLIKNDNFLSQLDKMVVMLNVEMLKISEKATDSQAVTSNPLKVLIMRNLIEIQRCDSSLSKHEGLRKMFSMNLLDIKPHVRESSVCFLGELCVTEPNLLEQFYSPFMDRIVDTSTAVRKCVIRWVTAILKLEIEQKYQFDIVCKLLGRLSDEEKSVQDQALKCLLDFLFVPLTMYLDEPSLDDLGTEDRENLVKKASFLSEFATYPEFPHSVMDKKIFMRENLFLSLLVEYWSNMLESDETNLENSGVWTILAIISKRHPGFFADYSEFYSNLIISKSPRNSYYTNALNIYGDIQEVIPKCGTVFCQNMERLLQSLIQRGSQPQIVSGIKAYGNFIKYQSKNLNGMLNFADNLFSELRGYLVVDGNHDKSNISQADEPKLLRTLFQVSNLLGLHEIASSLALDLPSVRESTLLLHNRLDLISYDLFSKAYKKEQTNVRLSSLYAIGSVMKFFPRCIPNANAEFVNILKACISSTLGDASTGDRLNLEKMTLLVINSIQEIVLREKELIEERSLITSRKEVSAKDLTKLDDNSSSTYVQIFIPYLLPMITGKFLDFRINEKALSTISTAVQDGAFHPMESLGYLIASLVIFGEGSPRLGKFRGNTLMILEYIGKKHANFAPLRFEVGLALVMESKGDKPMSGIQQAGRPGADDRQISVFQDYYTWVQEDKKRASKSSLLTIFIDFIERTMMEIESGLKAVSDAKFLLEGLCTLQFEHNESVMQVLSLLGSMAIFQASNLMTESSNHEDKIWKTYIIEYIFICLDFLTRRYNISARRMEAYNSNKGKSGADKVSVTQGIKLFLSAPTTTTTLDERLSLIEKLIDGTTTSTTDSSSIGGGKNVALGKSVYQHRSKSTLNDSETGAESSPMSLSKRASRHSSNNAMNLGDLSLNVEPDRKRRRSRSSVISRNYNEDSDS